jgi:putative sigma-54 modulation protein
VEIIVHGRNIDLSGENRLGVEQRVSHAARVFEQALDRVDVEVSEEPNPRRGLERSRVELTASVAGRVVRIEAAAATLESALDDAMDRLTRQLRRLKERLIDRNRQTEPSPPAEDAVDPNEVVRVKQFVMKPMTVEEATLQMDMIGHSFFFFHNSATDRQSVLYRRRDGRLGLIEPS